VLMLDPDDMTRKVGSAGRPVFFTDTRIVDPDLVDVAPGETGEILVRGPNVMRGYWNNPQATLETLVDGGWLRTGDAGRADDEGFVWIAGRIRDAYRSGGALVLPWDVEKALLEHPSVQDVAVVGRSGPDGHDVGVAFVVRRAPPVTEDDLLAWARARLERPDALGEVRFADAIPRNPAGKILRQHLHEAIADTPRPLRTG
jgi:fatty-acyl-CoA synthase